MLSIAMMVHNITKTLKNNGFPSNKCSFKKYLKNHNFRKTEKLQRFTSIPYVQGVSEPISRILTQVGIGVALKPHHTLSSLFRKPKDVINFEQLWFGVSNFLPGLQTLCM